jgi:hypothetical protein
MTEDDVLAGLPDDLAGVLRDQSAIVPQDGPTPGWPPITSGPNSPSHSPIDRYRCDNEDCPEDFSEWEFRPDDYDLDESVTNCPACGAEGELVHRWFRGGMGERGEVARRDAVLDWLRENNPRALEMCPYKLGGNGMSDDDKTAAQLAQENVDRAAAASKTRGFYNNQPVEALTLAELVGSAHQELLNEHPVSERAKTAMVLLEEAYLRVLGRSDMRRPVSP